MILQNPQISCKYEDRWREFAERVRNSSYKFLTFGGLDKSTNSYYNAIRIRIKYMGQREDMEDSYENIRRLMLAINKIDGSYYFFARKLGVKENTLALLYALDDGKPYSQKQICEDWLIPKTTVNTVVKELQEAGYITLLLEDNTREKKILLTDSGKSYTEELLKKVYAAEQEALNRTLQDFPAAFINAFEYFSKCLCEEFEKQVFEDHDGGKELNV